MLAFQFQVRGWLQKVFGDSTVPQYEINHRTVAVLYELMLRCEERDREKQLQTDDLNQKAEEYHAEGKLFLTKTKKNEWVKNEMK